MNFVDLSDPLSATTHTWCNPCNNFFPLSEFEWTDTGEKISDYYERHSSKASSMERLLYGNKFLRVVMVAAFIGCGVLAFVALSNMNMGRVTALVGAIVGAIVGAGLTGAVIVYGLQSFIMRRVCGVSDTRLLQ